MDNFIQELNRVHEQALAELRDMKWRNIHFERYEDYERGYASGHEEVMQEYENLVDDIRKILKSHDMETIQNAERVVSDNQLKLL